MNGSKASLWNVFNFILFCVHLRDIILLIILTQIKQNEFIQTVFDLPQIN